MALNLELGTDPLYGALYTVMDGNWIYTSAPRQYFLTLTVIQATLQGLHAKKVSTSIIISIIISSGVVIAKFSL